MGKLAIAERLVGDEILHLLVFRTATTIYFLSNVERNIFEQLEGMNTSWKLIPYASMLRYLS